MADIRLHPDIPANVTELHGHESDRSHRLFEDGHLLVIRGERISADFDFLSGIRIPPAMLCGHVKFHLTPRSGAETDRRKNPTWAAFHDQVFRNDKRAWQRFYDQVVLVNTQLHALAGRLFPRYQAVRKRVTWKFENITGQNLHIDNLAGCEDYAELRLFTNLAKTPRRWGIARHISAYAARHYRSADLGALVDDPFRFNNRLTAAAFGMSHQSVDDPRHHIAFETGEIWVVNSAVTAHQVQFGTLMAVDCIRFPYENFETAGALPNLLQGFRREFEPKQRPC